MHTGRYSRTMPKRSSTKSYSLPYFVMLWMLSMGWHLLHIARGKPRYENLSDTMKTVGSFMAVTGVVSLWRLSQSQPELPLLYAMTGMVAYWFILGLITMRKDRSDSLFCAFLGAGVVIDLVQSGLTLIFQSPAPAVVGIAVEVFILTRCWLHFMTMPKDVQASGFGRNR